MFVQEFQRDKSSICNTVNQLFHLDGFFYLFWGDSSAFKWGLFLAQLIYFETLPQGFPVLFLSFSLNPQNPPVLLVIPHVNIGRLWHINSTLSNELASFSF